MVPIPIAMMLQVAQRKQKQEARPSIEGGLASNNEGGWNPPTPS